MPPTSESVTFTCRGHPNVTGSHHKTVEFTRVPEISRRATCVLGVASTHDDAALTALRGRVEVTMRCGELADTFVATMSPWFLGSDALVFRPTSGLRGRTAGYDATKTAADVDRALVTALASNDATLTVGITQVGSGGTAGALFVVALPIGNDGDIGARATMTLERVDVVLAEDTRRLRALAGRLGIALPKVTSYHDHNEAERTPQVLELLEGGARVALVSDAGTPLLSDPGYVLVAAAVARGIGVSPVPGPSAALAVLSASGLPLDRFVFAGFLPRRSGQRRRALGRLAEPGLAIVCHEAPHRVAGLLADAAAVVPDWQVCIGREVTKVFEEFLRGTPGELAERLAGGEPLGEFTLVLAPSGENGDDEAPAGAPAAETVHLLRSLAAQDVRPATLAKALAEASGMARSDAYDYVLALRQGLS